MNYPIVALSALTATIAWAGSSLLADAREPDTIALARSSPVAVADVHDGDTFRSRAGRSYRLHGVDAPELCQDWGPPARVALAGILASGEVRSYRVSMSYQRQVADVMVLWPDGRWVDVSAEMVRRGLAMVDDRYVSGPREAALLAVEQVARERAVGMWCCKPVAPRDWRATHKGFRAPRCGR